LDAGWVNGPELPYHLEQFTIVNGGPYGNPIAVGGLNLIAENRVLELVKDDNRDYFWKERRERFSYRDHQAVALLKAQDFQCEIN